MKSLNCVLSLWIIVLPAFPLSELYFEGIYNENNLPGSENDNRNMPNTPFFTDTNRFSDGFTSSATVDITSPHFPLYHGSTADVSDRYKHFRDYAKSAAEQGIALFGAGDAQREDARVKITSQSNYEMLPKPSKTFPVYSAIKWNPSDFAIQEGEFYNITVRGSQTGFSSQFWYDGGIRVNAEGYESFFDAVSNCYVGMGRCRAHLKKKRRLLTANWMALTCAIGEFVRPLQEIEPGQEDKARWLPLDESALQETIFVVGQTTVFRAIYTGQLICFANDAHSEYWNNAGLLNVTVTRESWPPPKEVYYQDLYLQACDSALPVYANFGFQSKPNGTNGYFGDGNVKCNINGGGSGWKLSDILNTQTRYGSGAPESLLH